MKSEISFIGFIRRVVGAKIFVEISPDIPSANPIINGRIYRLGQIGSYVRIPLGFHNLYGIVAMVGASEAPLPDNEIASFFSHGKRWMEIQLVGETIGKGDFQRGISIFPTIDDEVHFVTEEDLALIYGTLNPSMITVGTHAMSENMKANLNLDKLITRHAAIVGSTGAGKSNSVAALLKSISTTLFPNSCIIVIDPHGEYGNALKGHARIFSVYSKSNPLQIPFWALSFDELAWFLVDRMSASESVQDSTLRDIIQSKKLENFKTLKSGTVKEELVTANSPIPFNINNIWYDTYTNENATLQKKEDWSSISYKKNDKDEPIRGDAEKVIPPEFLPPGPGGAPPFKSDRSKGMSSYLSKMAARLTDKRFNFLLKPGDYDGIKKDLGDLLNSWIGHDHGITVLDLAGIPSEVTDLIVGVVSRLLFEVMFWGRDVKGIGKQRPILIVYEEAHSYLPRGTGPRFIQGYAVNSAKKIFREGRKYGIGAIVVSQRPSELDETILSQCGTFIALRLSNSDDQGRVRSVIPDSLTGIVDLLPALRTGEAIVLGEAVQIPSRIRFPLIEPRPKSDDPEPSKQWRDKKLKNHPFNKVTTIWRNQGT